MALITLSGVALAYGGPSLLQSVDLRIDKGERVCLMGRNGTGKSSLMRLLHDAERPDAGEILRAPGLRTALLPQQVPPAVEGNVLDLVAAGAPGPRDEEPWQRQRRMEAVLEGLQLESNAHFAELSGGMKRRVFLARALVDHPDLLLLDEPTNHLDIRTITWLEEHLLKRRGAMLFVTHDRTLLGKLATRMVEIDRGALVSFPGDYATYQRRKAQALAAEESERALFDRKLAAEEVWIRKGIKARRTRNEGRVRALQKMREQRRQRREQMGTASMHIQQADASGKLVVNARDVSFAYDDAVPIVRDLSTTILRGDRVGLIGPNGVGKTTLLRVLLGQLKPDGGRIRLGTRLDVAYLDQLRAQLRDDRTVADNVADGADTVRFGRGTKHVIGYLKEFLFSPDRARSPTSVLSGGERNRLLLARLFARPSNLLVLDEPTNDLDAETLELLEEQLLGYEGTVLLVSHDRTFLDHVVTSTLVFEGEGRVAEYVGGYEDWLRQRAPEAEPARPRVKKARRRPDTPRARKRTYAENLELAEIPDRLEALEEAKEEAEARLADPDLYKAGGDAVKEAQAAFERTSAELSELYDRWEFLEGLPER